MKIRISQINGYLLGIALKPFLCRSSWKSEEQFIRMLFLLCWNIVSKCDHFVCRWLHAFFWLLAQHPRNLFSRTTSQQWAPPQKNRRCVKIYPLLEVIFYCNIIELVGKGLATCAWYWRGAWTCFLSRLPWDWPLSQCQELIQSASLLTFAAYKTIRVSCSHSFLWSVSAIDKRPTNAAW